MRLIRNKAGAPQGLEIREELIEQDLEIPEDRRTADFLVEVANSIHNSITVKADFPSNNPDGRMPLLDLKVWVDENNMAKFSFYSKECSSKFFIPFISAHSMSMKKRMLANEGFRRLVNISPDLPWDESVRVMNEFCVKMWRSGYPATWRAEAVSSVIQRLEKALKEERDGVRPLFLPKGFMEEERRMAKLRKLKSWHNTGAEAGLLAGAPLILCPMAGSSISKQIKQVCKKFEKEHKIGVRLYERGGNKIENFVRSDPLKPKTCGRENCFPCKSGGGGDCARSCAAYRVDCLECETENLKAVYIGETGRNGYARGLEHQDGLEKEKEDNPLWKHCQIQHSSRKVQFKMTCLKSFKTAFMRQVNEGVRIACCDADICMNSKMQFHQPAIVRVSAALGNLNEDQAAFNFQPRGRGRGGRSRGDRSRGLGRGRAGDQGRRPRGD